MARYRVGDIVLMPFPFSGESAYKHRPALVLALWNYAGGTDYLTCLVTTQPAKDPFLTEILREDTEGRHLARSCYLRPTYLFATGEHLISRKLDRLMPEKLHAVVETIVRVLTAKQNG